MGLVRYCENCQGEYEPTWFTQRYCEECKRIVRNRMKREGDIKKRAAERHTGELELISKLARQEGVSYGKYVAEHHL